VREETAGIEAQTEYMYEELRALKDRVGEEEH